MKKIFIIGCFLVALVAVTFLIFEKLRMSAELNQTEQKSYEDDEMGIRFSYPSLLVLRNNPTENAHTVCFYGEEDEKIRKNGVFFEGPSNMIAIHSFKDMDYQKEVNRVISNVSNNRRDSEMTFKGYPAKEILGNYEQFGVTLNSRHIVVNKNGRIYSLGVVWHSDAKLEEQFNEMLNSLEFIE